jgi:hypothetical protein
MNLKDRSMLNTRVPFFMLFSCTYVARLNKKLLNHNSAGKEGKAGTAGAYNNAME